MNNKKTNNSNTKPAFKASKPVSKTIPLVVTGDAGHGKKFNPEDVRTLLNELVECNCFDKLSVLATMPKSMCFNNPDARGVIGVARINSYDAEADNLSVTFFGKNVAYADMIDESMAMTVRVHLDRDNVVDTITSFDIVPMMDI